MRCAVVGSPIAHSLSPVMHRAAYGALGLHDWTYDAFDVDEDGIGAFLASLGEDWGGLSLTMPLKRAVLPYLDVVDEVVREVGGANTVVLADGERRGFNTDVPGAVAALRERGVDEVEDAVVIGGGATAESVVAALRRLGLARVTLAARTVGRAEEIAGRVRAQGTGDGPALAVDVVEIGPDMARSAEVVVSTVPSDAVAPYADDLVARCDAVFDVVYDPWPTVLARTATAQAVPVVSGIDLLAHQAAEQVRLITGHEVAPGLLREAAVQALAVG